MYSCHLTTRDTLDKIKALYHRRQYETTRSDNPQSVRLPEHFKSSCYWSTQTASQPESFPSGPIRRYPAQIKASKTEVFWHATSDRHHWARGTHQSGQQLRKGRLIRVGGTCYIHVISWGGWVASSSANGKCRLIGNAIVIYRSNKVRRLGATKTMEPVFHVVPCDCGASAVRQPLFVLRRSLVAPSVSLCVLNVMLRRRMDRFEIFFADGTFNFGRNSQHQ